MSGRWMVLLSVTVVMANAQDKPLPESGRELTAGKQPGSSLPSFDLPEFVITGRESIDLPAAEKRGLGGDAERGAITRPSTSAEGRTNDEPEGSDVPHVLSGTTGVHNGRAYIGIGSFSTFLAGLQASGTIGTVHAQGDAEYSSTQGFDPNTDADHVHMNGGVRIPTDLTSGFLLAERIAIDGSFNRNGYHWYGTAVPHQTRTTSFGFGSAGISGYLSGGARASIALSYGGAAVRDSNASVTEGMFGLSGKFQQDLLGLPMTFQLRTRTIGKTGGTGGSYGGMVLGAGTQWSPVPELTLHVSAGVASVSGEAGQSETTFLPGFSAEFLITPAHRFIGTYSPSVELRDMHSMVREVPFLTASGAIRHTLVRNKGTIGIQSDWGTSLRSTVELETSTSSDYPVVADTGGTGVFTIHYGDVKETLIRASVVAKLPPNHYFSAIAIVRSSKSSSSGLSVPYLPLAELRLGYRNEVTERLVLDGTVQFVSARESSLSGSSTTVPAYVRADVRAIYGFVQGLKMWASVRNLFDSPVEHWAGYREPPFGLNIGISYAM